MDPGDISQQIALREKLQCKPFKWFMQNIAFDLPKHYPPVEPKDFVGGEIRSLEDNKLCVDSKFRGANERIGLDKCSKDSPGSSGEQRFSLTWRKVIRCLESCFVILSLCCRISDHRSVVRCAGMSAVTMPTLLSYCMSAMARGGTNSGSK